MLDPECKSKDKVVNDFVLHRLMLETKINTIIVARFSDFRSSRKTLFSGMKFYGDNFLRVFVLFNYGKLEL